MHVVGGKCNIACHDQERTPYNFYLDQTYLITVTNLCRNCLNIIEV